MIDATWSVIARICAQWQRFFLTYFLICTLTYGGIVWLGQYSWDVRTALGILAGTWIVFAFLAALGDVLVGFIDEWLLGRLRSTHALANAPGKLILISGFFGGVVAIGVLLATLFWPTLTITTTGNGVLYGVLAGALEVAWLIPYFYALDRSNAITATPLFQTVPVFSLVFGVLVFNEIPLISHLVAASLVVLGAILLNYKVSDAKVDARSVQLMLLASAIISVGYFLFKTAATDSDFTTALFWNGVGMTIVSALLWLFHTPYRTQFNTFIKHFDARVLLVQTGNESLAAASTMAAQYALVLGPSVFAVTAMNALHPLLTVSIGFLLAASGSLKHQTAFSVQQRLATTGGIGLILVGVVLMSI